MKRLLSALFYFIAFALSTGELFAQIDIQTFEGKSTDYVIFRLGNPLTKTIGEYEGSYTVLEYHNFRICIYDDSNKVLAARISTPDICILSDYISGGLRVGDNISKIIGVDFSARKDNPAYFFEKSPTFSKEDNLKKLVPELPHHGYTFNYVLFREHELTCMFAVENDIIKVIEIY